MLAWNQGGGRLNTQPRFCPYCGERQRPGARFCKACGEPLPVTGAIPPQGQAISREGSIPPPIPTGKRVESQLTSAIGSAAKSAGKAALQAAVSGAPWQVVVGKQLPPNAIQNILKSAGQAAVRSAGQSLKSGATQLGSSLLGPAFFSFISTIATLVAPLLTDSGQNASMVAPKIGLALVNLITGAVAGRRRGLASVLMLIANAVLALLQGGTLIDTFTQIMNDPDVLGGLLPDGIVQGLSVLAAVRAAVKALKK